MSKQDVVQEIHKPARKTFKRRRYTMYDIAETLQADLIEVQKFKKENKNHRYILIVIDVFTKYAYTEPLKDKTAGATTQAMKRILEKATARHPNYKIRHLHSDDGKEFFNREMRQLLDKYEINHYSTFSGLKASIVERLIRTIKRWLYMEFSIEGKYKWLDLLPKIIERYNNTR